MNIRSLPVIVRPRRIVDAARHGPPEHRPAVVVVDILHVRRKNDAVVIVHFYGKVRPPHEGVLLRGRVIDGDLRTQAGALQRELRLALHAVKRVVLSHAGDPPAAPPYDLPVRGHVRRGAVMLREIELYPAGDPRPCQPDHRGLQYPVAVDEIIAVRLIQRGIHLPADRRQQLDARPLVFQNDPVVFDVPLLIAQPRRVRERIDLPARALIRALFKVQRERLALSHGIGGDDKFFLCYFCLHKSRRPPRSLPLL